jgi:hypothetical protein
VTDSGATQVVVGEYSCVLDSASWARSRVLSPPCGFRKWKKPNQNKPRDRLLLRIESPRPSQELTLSGKCRISNVQR